jgi:hypothetical protein
MIRRILLPLNTLRSSRRRTESLLLLSLSFLSFNETLAVSLFFFASVARFCAYISVVAGKDLQKEKRKD